MYDLSITRNICLNKDTTLNNVSPANSTFLYIKWGLLGRSLHELVKVVKCDTLCVQRNCPASILRKSTSGRHRPVSYPDGPMTARYRFT